MQQVVTARRSEPKLKHADKFIELLAWLILAPILLTYRTFAWLPLALLGLLVLGRYFFHNDIVPRPVRGPILLWLPLLALSLVIAIQPDAAWSRGWAYLFGFLTLSVVYNVTDTPRLLWLALWTWLLIGIAMTGIGVVGTVWLTEKLFRLGPLYQLIPSRLFRFTASFGSQAGINPNTVAGNVLPLLYVPLGLLVSSLRQARSRKLVLLLLPLILLLGVALVITQSRGGYIAAIAGALALLVLRWSRLAWLLLSLTGILALLLSLDGVNSWLTQIDWSDFFQGRLIIWQRAWFLIQDFGFTGLGLNMFAPVSARLYPLFLEPGPPAVHAHNIFLQMTLDFGVFGLLAFIWLFTRLLVSGVRALNSRRQNITNNSSWVLRGLLAGQVAFLVFNLTDVLNLGSKQSFLYWAAWGLILRWSQTTTPATTTIADTA